MNFSEYQQRAKQTALYPDAGNNFIYPAMGLAGEAGEVINKVKKIFRDDNNIVTPSRREEISKELGDLLWYTAQLSTELGLSLDHVAQDNLVKLQKRQDLNLLSGSGDNREEVSHVQVSNWPNWSNF